MALTGRASLLEGPPPPSEPGGEPGDFEATARLTVRPTGLLFRALRAEEVEWLPCGDARLVGGGLRLKQRGSGMGAARAVACGSTDHRSEFVHTTTDVTVAAYFATSRRQGGHGSSGLVAVQ